MTSPLVIQPGESLQRLQTGWTDEFEDQFGRKFAANYDIRNMRPKEELRPVGFNPPWLPPMKYIKWEREGGFRFRWDLETCANDLAESETSYYSDVFGFMAEHMPGEPIPDVGEPVPTKVLRGPPGKAPLSSAIPLACLAGDPWMLGVPGAKVNPILKTVLEQSATSNGRKAVAELRERLAKAVGENAVPQREPEEDPSHKPTRSINDVDPVAITQVTYREFLSAALKSMSMADAALAWKAHRDNLAVEGAA